MSMDKGNPLSPGVEPGLFYFCPTPLRLRKSKLLTPVFYRYRPEIVFTAASG